MIAALFLTLRQLGDPPILRVLAGSILLTLLLFAGAAWGLHAWLASLHGCIAPLGIELCAGDAGLSTIGTLLLSLAGLWLLFPAVAIGVMGVFSDAVVAAVERRHYPAAAASARPPGWMRATRMGAASAARMLGYNLLATPFYIVLIVTGVGPFLLALVVNGWAIGRDLWEMVAARHVPAQAMRAEIAASRGVPIAAGLVIAGLFVVPVVNLLAPVIGAGIATHLYHRRQRQ